MTRRLLQAVRRRGGRPVILPTTISPGVATLTLTGIAPTVTATANKVVTPSVAALTLTGIAPTVTSSGYNTVSPAVAALTLTGIAPTVATTANKIVTPTVAALTLTGIAPTVVSSGHNVVTPTRASLTLTGIAPTVAVTGNKVVTPAVAALVLTGRTPTIIRSNNKIVTPTPAALVLTGIPPTLLGATVADEFTSLSANWVDQYPLGDEGYGLDSHFSNGVATQVSVSGGVLTIQATRTAGLSGGRTFKSASITNADFAFKFGTWEARIWYAKGQGLWPAFWFLKSTTLTSTPPELDVFESYPGTGIAVSHGSSGAGHAVTTFHSQAPDTIYVDYDYGSDLSLGYHVWRVEWPDSTHLRTYLDGVLMKQWTANLPTAAIQPIFSHAYGATGYRIDDGSTTPDTQYKVDYIRYYAP